MFRRYEKYAQPVTVNGITYDSGLSFVDFLYSGKIAWHKVQNEEDGRIDLIAWKYLKDPMLWWPIYLYNQLTDPINDVYPGAELAIPVDFVPDNSIIPFSYVGTQ